ncbi:hypothetical protein [Subtercola boreus]|nr:hypothetical protein [Subtercola boreus]
MEFRCPNCGHEVGREDDAEQVASFLPGQWICPECGWQAETNASIFP